MADTKPIANADDAANRYKWYVLFILTAAQACHYLDRTIIALVVEPVRVEFGLNDGQLGFLSGLGYGIAFAVAAIPLGWLVDRYNRRNILASILFLWSGLTAVCGLANSYLTLLLGRMAVGAAEAGGSPTGMSILSDYFPPRQRSSALSIWYASSAFGIITTFVVGGYIAQHYGWRNAFFFAGAPGLIISVLVILTLKEPRRGASDALTVVGSLSMKESAAALIRQPVVLHTMMGIILAGMTVSGFSVWTVAFFTRQYGLDLSQSGYVAAMASGVCGAIGGIGCGFFADRINARYGGYSPQRMAVLCAFTALSSLFIGATALLSGSLWVAMGVYFVYAMFNTAHNGPANALVLTMVSPAMRGFSISSLQVCTNLISWGMGPFLVGVLSDRIGGPQSLRWALLLSLLVHVWAALYFFLAARCAKRDAHIAATGAEVA
ncbi:MAG: MFS transporter [Porticoccaceae bacterium]|nr:MFS transporter [Porticoccaceae bacterium]